MPYTEIFTVVLQVSVLRIDILLNTVSYDSHQKGEKKYSAFWDWKILCQVEITSVITVCPGSCVEADKVVSTEVESRMGDSGGQKG